MAHGNQAQVSVNAATGTGAGATIDLGDSYGTHTMVCTGVGTPAVNVDFQVSHDGVNWVTHRTVQYVSGVNAQDTYQVVARYVRGNVSFFSGSTSVTATIASV